MQTQTSWWGQEVNRCASDGFTRLHALLAFMCFIALGLGGLYWNLVLH